MEAEFERRLAAHKSDGAKPLPATREEQMTTPTPGDLERARGIAHTWGKSVCDVSLDADDNHHSYGCRAHTLGIIAAIATGFAAERGRCAANVTKALAVLDRLSMNGSQGDIDILEEAIAVLGAAAIRKGADDE